MNASLSILAMLCLNYVHVQCSIGGVILHTLNPFSKSSNTSLGQYDAKRQKGNFTNIKRVKIRQQDLPLDTRLYVAPDARIEGDRDYEDGKGY